MAREFYVLPFADPRAYRRRQHRSPLTQLALLDDRMLDMGGMLSSLDRDIGDLFRQLAQTEGRRGGNGFDFSSPSVQSHVEGEGEGTANYVMNVPLGSDIGPEDLKVSLKDHVMTIEAKKEQKSEDGNCRVYQEFTRKFTLPKGIDMKEVKSTLTPEGYLKIEAPLPKPPQETLPEPPKPQAIPIQLE